MHSNFTFLKEDFPILANLAESAELNSYSDPVTALFKLRLFGEKYVHILFDEHGMELPEKAMFLYSGLQTNNKYNVFMDGENKYACTLGCVYVADNLGNLDLEVAKNILNSLKCYLNNDQCKATIER